MQRIEIKASNKKMIIMAFGCVIMLLISYIIFRDADKYVSYIFRSSSFIKITGIAGIIFSGIGSIFLIRKALKKKIGLIIDKDGITDNSNAISIGLMKWEDIKGVRITNVMSTKFVIIDLINQDYYLGQTKNKFKQRLMEYNIKIYGTPITINSTTLDCSFQDLEDYIRNGYKYYKENS